MTALKITTGDQQSVNVYKQRRTKFNGVDDNDQPVMGWNNSEVETVTAKTLDIELKKGERLVIEAA